MSGENYDLSKSLLKQFEATARDFGQDFPKNDIRIHKDVFIKMCDACLFTKQAKRFDRSERLIIEFFKSYLEDVVK